MTSVFWGFGRQRHERWLFAPQLEPDGQFMPPPLAVLAKRRILTRMR
jgi:hypothetical protein